MSSENWHKSSYSGGGHQNCVECRAGVDQVLIRDTQHRALGHLSVSSAEWRAFLYAVRGNELD